MASPSPPREAATTERNRQRRIPKSVWWLIMIIFLVILNMRYSTVEIRPMVSEFIGSDSRQSTANFSSSATQEIVTNVFSKRLETTNLDGNNEDIRIIALCGDATFFDEAFHKISEWLPIIWYAGMYRRPEENSTIPQHVWCDNEIERWVVSELKRRQLSIPTSTTSIEVIHSSANGRNVRGLTLNTTLIGRSQEPAIWVGGMHRPPRRTHFQRFINNWGEVAWSKKMQCSQKDDSKINVYRSRKLWSLAQEENCAVVHLPAILPYAKGILEHRIQNGESPANETLSSLLSNKRTREEAHQNLESKDKFAVLITLTTFQPRYSTDALVRHALCRLLTKQYKPCIARASWKGQVHNITIGEGVHNTHKGMQDFKFAITMTNHFQDGYIAEKTLHPYLASTVAITAIPNVGQYVNADGMVVCNLPEEELRKVQLYYKGSFHWMPFNTTPEMWQSNDEIKPIKYDPYANNKMGDEPVLEFATSQWEKPLQPCIEEIIRLDQDDDAYIEKLMQPYLLNEGKNSMFDGTYLAMNMLQWFQWANSPLVKGLEDAISGLDGMREQTPGWGLPLTNSFDGVDYLSKTKNEEGNHQFLSLPVKGRTTESVLPSRPQPLDNTSCPFCEDNGVPNLELSVPDTGDNTCGSIKTMAVREANGTDVCKIIQKKESVCCPSSDHALLREKLTDTPAPSNDTSNKGYGGFFTEGNEMLCWSPVAINDEKSFCRVMRIVNTTANGCDKYLFATWEDSKNSKWVQKAMRQGAKIVFVSDPCRQSDACKMKERGKWGLGLRSKLMWKYVHAKYQRNFSWFWRIDDDTFFSGANARKFVKQHNPKKEMFFGLQVNDFVSGMAFGLSTAALDKMANNFDSPNKDIDCSLENRHGDDVATSKCLATLNVTITNIKDKHGYHYLGAFFKGDAMDYSQFLPRPGREKIDQSTLFGITSGNKNDIGCCSIDLIGYHAPFKTCDDRANAVWNEMYNRFR